MPHRAAACGTAALSHSNIHPTRLMSGNRLYACNNSIFERAFWGIISVMRGRSNLSTSLGGLAMRRRAIVLLTALAFAAVASPLPSWGQAPPAALPPAAEPGRLQQQFQPLTQPGAPPAITLPASPTTTPPPNAANIHLQVQAIVIQGATVY